MTTIDPTTDTSPILEASPDLDDEYEEYFKDEKLKKPKGKKIKKMKDSYDR